MSMSERLRSAVEDVGFRWAALLVSVRHQTTQPARQFGDARARNKGAVIGVRTDPERQIRVRAAPSGQTAGRSAGRLVRHAEAEGHSA
jgi:hypothetical protein